MFTTLFQKNKINILAISLLIGMFLLVIINIIVLVPAMTAIFTPVPKPADKQLIDVETINKAVELITPK